MVGVGIESLSQRLQPRQLTGPGRTRPRNIANEGSTLAPGKGCFGQIALDILPADGETLGRRPLCSNATVDRVCLVLGAMLNGKVG